MITVPTHKHHKSPFQHAKTIHIFTSGPLIVTVQILVVQAFKGVKMTTARLTSIQEQSRSNAILLQELMKRDVCRCGVEML
jgi:hypothetical protein